MFFKRFLGLLLSLFCGSALAQQPDDAQNVRLLCNWSDNANIPSVTGAYYNDVWGLTWRGKEYAAVGSAAGLHIIDVADCRQVAFKAGKNASPFVYHRDVKTYKNYLYVVAQESEASLQVFDFSYLPDSLHLVWESSSAELATAHSLFIDTNAGRLYASTVAGTTTGADALRIYSLANPELPVRTHRIGAPQGILSPVHTVFARRDTAFLSVSNYGYLVATFGPNDTFKIIGGTTSYPSQGYTHSSWVNDAGYGVLADETGGLPLKIINTRNLPQVSVVSTFSPCNGDTCTPHNPFLVGNTAFISHYYQGVQIYDITNREEAVRVGYYDTSPGTARQSYGGAWGCYPYLPSGKVLVSDMQRGLFVLDASDAIALSLPAELNTELKLKLFPNPATNAITVQGLPLFVSNCEVEIWEGATGRRVLQQSQNVANGSFSVALPANLPVSMYLLRVIAGGKSYRVSFLKKE
jgi:choice-of-anchor B domain-containing protein